MGRYYDTEEELLHYGVLGMKWGIRRYQPYSYTGGGNGKEIGEAARKGGRILKAKEIISNNKKKASSMIKQYKKKKQLKKARQAKIEKALESKRLEERRKAMIKEITKDATSLNKNKDAARELLSNDEYNKIVNRLNDEQRTYDLHRKKQGRTRQTVEDILGWSSTLIKGANQIQVWNKILNGDKANSNKDKSGNNSSNESKLLITDSVSKAAEKMSNKMSKAMKAAKTTQDIYNAAKEADSYFKKETGMDISDFLDKLDTQVVSDPSRMLPDKRRK